MGWPSGKPSDRPSTSRLNMLYLYDRTRRNHANCRWQRTTRSYPPTTMSKSTASFRLVLVFLIVTGCCCNAFVAGRSASQKLITTASEEKTIITAVKAQTGGNGVAIAVLSAVLTWTEPMQAIAAAPETPAVEISQTQKTLLARLFYAGCIAEWLYLTIKQPGSSKKDSSRWRIGLRE